MELASYDGSDFSASAYIEVVGIVGDDGKSIKEEKVGEVDLCPVLSLSHPIV